MKGDIRGCATCPRGEERWEEINWAGPALIRVQYDYRTPDGELFSCIAVSLESARRRRDDWLERRELAR